MIVIYGTRSYGKIYTVDDLFYVVTTFFHIYFVPLIPVRSYVVPVNGGEEVGAQIPVQPRSVLAAWLRLVCIPLLLVSAPIAALTVAAVFIGNGDRVEQMAMAGKSLLFLAMSVGILMFTRSRRFTEPSYTKVQQLCDALGVSEERRIIIALRYGQVSEEDAQRRIAEIDIERAAVAARAREEAARVHAEQRARVAAIAAQRAAKCGAPAAPTAPVTVAKVTCPACKRTVRKQARCLYCGAALSDA